MSAALDKATPWIRAEILLDPSLATATLKLRTATQTAKDVLFVHLLGHAYFDGNSMELHLLMNDSTVEHFPRGTLNISTLLEEIRETSSVDAIVLIVDTCFSGGVIPNSRMSTEGNTFILTASTAGQVAIDGPRSLTGILASTLLKGVPDCPFPLFSIGEVARTCAREFEWDDISPVIGRMGTQDVATFSAGDAHRVAIGLNVAVHAPR